MHKFRLPTTNEVNKNYPAFLRVEGGKEPGREDTMWINLREEISALEGEEEWKKGDFEILDKKDRKGGREEENKETILKEERGKEEGGKEKVKEGQESGSGDRVKVIKAGSIPEVMSGRSQEVTPRGNQEKGHGVSAPEYYSEN